MGLKMKGYLRLEHGDLTRDRTILGVRPAPKTKLIAVGLGRTCGEGVRVNSRPPIVRPASERAPLRSTLMRLGILLAAIALIVLLLGPPAKRLFELREPSTPMPRTETIDGVERPCTDYGDHSWYDHEPYIDECRDSGHGKP